MDRSLVDRLAARESSQGPLSVDSWADIHLPMIENTRIPSTLALCLVFATQAWVSAASILCLIDLFVILSFFGIGPGGWGDEGGMGDSSLARHVKTACLSFGCNCYFPNAIVHVAIKNDGSDIIYYCCALSILISVFPSKICWVIERPQLFFCDASSGLLHEQLGQAMWIIGDKGKLSSTSKLFLTGVS